MGTIIDLNEYRKCNDIEEDYNKFLTAVHKTIGVPTSYPDLVKTFSFLISYLEGTINAFDIITLVKRVPEHYTDELRNQVIKHLEGLIEELKTNQ